MTSSSAPSRRNRRTLIAVAVLGLVALTLVTISPLRAYVTGANLITITKYTGYDPEVSAFNDNDAQIGVDFSNYPTARTVTFGIGISF